MSEQIDIEMGQKVTAAREALASGSGTAVVPESVEPKNATELREILKKFRRAMGSVGNPGTFEAEVALRAGWIIASGPVEGYGEEIFHVFMLTNGALFYFSGEVKAPIDFTGRWTLGDAIPSLEAKIPDTVAHLMAQNELDWPATPQL